MMKVHYDDYGRATNFQDLKKSGYIISTKDLCLYSVLDQIVRLPVAALKIEGRMRTAAYVAFVTSVYRKALDAIRSGTFHPHHHDIIDLSLHSLVSLRTVIQCLDYSHVMGRTIPAIRDTTWKGYLVSRGYRENTAQNPIYSLHP
jgi:putative protease